jgi:hypothetical protein
MKNISIIYNIESNTWTENISDYENDFQSILEFSIISSKELTNIKGLKLECTVMLGPKQIENFVYPPNNVMVDTTSSAPVFSEQFETLPDSEYSIHCWLQKNAEEFTHDIILRTGKPEKEFPSWVWSPEDRMWAAPKLMPGIGPYTWDEELLDWVYQKDTPMANPGPGYEVE